MSINPCVFCGACCAFYCVAFPKDETEQQVPVALTSPLDEIRCFMKGTRSKKPRCIALEGCVGQKVRCRIYSERPSACRHFFRSWENGKGNFLCDKARSFFGLPSFSKY